MSAQFASASDLVPAFDDDYPLNYFPFTELNSSRPRLVAAVCQDLKKINSAETIRGNTVLVFINYYYYYNYVQN